MRLLAAGIAVAVIAGASFAWILWDRAFRPNITTGENTTVDIVIPSGSGIDDVINILENKGLVRNMASLNWVAAKKNYHSNVRPGNYRLRDGMNNNDLINMLRSGSQIPVRLVFISQRSVEQIASVVSRQIEADSSEIADLANNHQFIESLGFDRASLPALFIPNTYEFYWNTSAEQFFRRMKTEYIKFWNTDREKKREALGLDRVQVSTLASIVSEETVKADEMPVIAGVYINRLKRGMPLQADPTVKFALGDVTINRILRADLDVDSPYNTYRNPGLPPGPIVIPPLQAVEAVLNAQEHDYLFFAAKEDFSGYHRFARTLSEHNRNARLYQNALNQRRIFR